MVHFTLRTWEKIEPKVELFGLGRDGRGIDIDLGDTKIELNFCDDAMVRSFCSLVMQACLDYYGETWKEQKEKICETQS